MRVSLFNKIVKLNSINSNRYYNNSSGINTGYYNCYSNNLNNKYLTDFK
ncbi:hypothetical protein [Campylobacter devanensis]|nr:hypothetical protein [Campylobacter sp. P0087]